MIILAPDAAGPRLVRTANRYYHLEENRTRSPLAELFMKLHCADQAATDPTRCSNAGAST